MSYTELAVLTVSFAVFGVCVGTLVGIALFWPMEDEG